jgi:hypothetical protein
MMHPGGRLFPSLACFILISGMTHAQERNTVDSIKTVQSKVEIQVSSTKEFPVRDQLVVLQIGSKQFTLSRYPADGRLNTLIFTLAAEEFDQLNNGDDIIVQYGREESTERWRFGKLDKTQRDKNR